MCVRLLRRHAPPALALALGGGGWDGWGLGPLRATGARQRPQSLEWPPSCRGDGSRGPPLCC